MKTDFLIVGAGFFGSVIAERIASVLKKSVLIIDRREHIGGNCHSRIEPETGIEYHKYGPHIFHTSNKKVWEYVSQFTKFNNYRHQTLTTHQNKVFQMPINLETINTFYGRNFRPSEARDFIQSEIEKEKYLEPKNLEEKAISLIGRPLYEAFIRWYTMKQWDRDPKELPTSIITRLPVRYTYNEDYFNECNWQGIPVDGYTKVFERLLDNKNIRIETGVDYFTKKNQIEVKHATVYTGPIDALFNYEFGKLDWRSVRFEHRIVNEEDFQGTSIMNYADPSVPYTRSIEPRHFHPERKYNRTKTLVMNEFSDNGNVDPYYPIRDERNSEKLKKYLSFAEKEKNLIVGGRLGDFMYYDMDMTIASALKRFESKILPFH